jgi:hypothetical protein
MRMKTYSSDQIRAVRVEIGSSSSKLHYTHAVLARQAAYTPAVYHTVLDYLA